MNDVIMSFDHEIGKEEAKRQALERVPTHRIFIVSPVQNFWLIVMVPK